LTRLAAQTLKAVDPHIRVIGPSPYSVGYLRQFLDAGAAPFLDVVGYHIYDNPPEDDARILADVRTVMSKAGVGSLPLWITEGATGGGQGLDETTAAGRLARKFLVELMYGSSQFSWYTWGTENAFCLATTRANLIDPTPAGRALGYLQGWLVGAHLRSARIDEAGNWVLKTRDPTGLEAYVVWNPAGPARWAVPSGFQPARVDDLFGNSRTVGGTTSLPVGTEPLHVVGAARR
jgi:hypothetical protein